MSSQADLHTHTLYSDGALSPRDLIKKAKNVGLKSIGITDHDTVDGIEEAEHSGKEFDVDVIPGVELSTTLEDREIHILGYFIDIHNKTLGETLQEFRGQRLKRAERIIGKLNKINIPLTMESVLEHSNGTVGRPHIANALVNQGHAESFREAFSKYIGQGCPAFERKPDYLPMEAIRLIGQCGGLSFLAHPGNSLNDSFISYLIKQGLDGIEVVHPSHSPEVVKYYRGIVEEYCLLESGGSDFHGGIKGDDHLLGRIAIPLASVEIMRRRLVSN